MANSITSLRAIGRHGLEDASSSARAGWRRCCASDPSGFYPRMTFATRDRYRHVVERIAKRTRRSGGGRGPARDRAGPRRRGAATPDDRRRAHVGYYLIDDGLAELERTTGYRPPLRRGGSTAGCARHPNIVFVGGVVLSARWPRSPALLWLAGPARARRVARSCCCSRCCPAADIAVNVVNQLVTAFLPPRTLPEARPRTSTACRPSSARRWWSRRCSAAWTRCARRWRTSRCSTSPTARPHLHFAVLSDFTDAPAETRDGRRRDRRGRGRGRARAQRPLRRRTAEDAFYLFHRPRRWNPQRGRVDGLGAEARQAGRVQPLRAAAARAEAFSVDRRATSAPLRAVRYVITLDADTVLPPDAAPLAGRHAGASAQPRRVRPRRWAGWCAATASCSRGSASRCRARTARASRRSTPAIPGVDPYTTAVSDVYQDLYGEGSFTGKGIYDVDAFEQATHGRFPENTLLSHDLIEGNYARAGLATDVDGLRRLSRRATSPTRGASTAGSAATGSCCPGSRRCVPGPDGPERNRLSLLSRWKILDNLRRSTVELAQLAVPGRGLDAAARLAAPLDAARRSARSPRRGSSSLLLAVLRPPLDKSWRAYYAAVGRDAIDQRAAARARPRLPAAPGVRLGRRDRPHALAHGRVAAAPARVADGVAGSSAAPADTRAAWRAMWPAVARRRRARGGRDSWLAACATRRELAPLPAARRLWLRLAGHRARRSARPPWRRGAAALPPGSRRAGAPVRAAPLALLRPLRQRRDELARAGQLPGGSRAGRGDAHLAHQHRPPAARHGERARPRLHHRSRR